MEFPLEDIAVSLDSIAKTPRREGETAFPEIAVLIGSVKSVGRDKRIAENKERLRLSDSEERQHRIDHPEEYFPISELVGEAAKKLALDKESPVREDSSATS